MQKCYDCLNWVGRCLLGKINKIAADFACNDFRSKILRRNGKAFDPLSKELCQLTDDIEANIIQEGTLTQGESV